MGAAALAATLVLALTPARAEDPWPYILCGHVPITGTASIPQHPDRFGQFYFDYVNTELGGIDEHPVEFIAINDSYYPAGARNAAERCLERDAHILVGHSGMDQIVAVARWAEQREIPYLHGSASETILAGETWSASLGPSDEDQMRALGHAIGRGDLAEDPRPAIVLVNSPFYEPGREALEETLTGYGVSLAASIPHEKYQGQFTPVWLELIRAEANIVVLYISPSMAATMMNQRPEFYQPAFAGLALGHDVVSTLAYGNPTFLTLEDPGPVYRPDDASLPWYDEMQEFLRIFHTYSPETDPPPDQVNWNAYLRAKQLHRFLDALDEDLSPEHIRAQFSLFSETADEASPTCALDFQPEPRIGQRAWHVFSLKDRAWTQASFCVDEVDVDLTPPEIDCGAVLQVAATARCTITDPGSGIASYEVAATGIPGPATATYAEPGCLTEPVVVELDLPTGLHEVRARATNCAGGISSATVRVLALA